jgi:transcriptional regulator with XRE-family HTH domain
VIPIGKAICIARGRRGSTQADLARRAGLTESRVNSLENGRGWTPTLDVLVRISAGLGMSVSELVKMAEEMEVRQ